MSDTNGDRQRHYIDRKKVVAIAKELDGVLIKRHDGLYEYRLGFTDKSIADSHQIPIDGLKRLRKELFGELFGAKSVGSLDDLYAKITRLEDRVVKLERYCFDNTLDMTNVPTANEEGSK